MKDQHTLIKGYRNLTQDEIDLMNEIKARGVDLDVLIEKLQAIPTIDMRWVAIGKTDLQTGLMALTRSVAQPTTV